MNNSDVEKLGFFSGMLLGMVLPLLLLGGEIKGKAKPTEAFYGGIILGVLLDIALVVGLTLLFRH